MYIYYDRDTIEVFDSLGGDETKLNILKKYIQLRGIKSIEYNESAFQKETTASCGLFVLYFLFERLFNLDLTFDELLEDIFENNIDENEKKVTEFCQNILLDKEV